MPETAFDLWDGNNTSLIEGVLNGAFMALISIIDSTPWTIEYDMDVLPSSDASTVRAGNGGSFTLADNEKMLQIEQSVGGFDRFEYTNAGIDFDTGISIYMKAGICLWEGGDNSAAGFIVDDSTDRIFVANSPRFLGVYNLSAVSHGEGGVVEIVWTMKRAGGNVVCNAWIRSDQQEWIQVITNQNATLGGGSATVFMFGTNTFSGSLVIDYDLVKFFLGDIDPNTNGFFDKTSPSPGQKWNEFVIGKTVSMSDIIITENARPDDTGSLFYKYAKNNEPLSSSLTQAELRDEPDFVVTHANSFKVVPQLFSSNGVQPVSVAAVGRVVTTDAVTEATIFKLPLEVIERPGLEVIEL